LKTSYIKIKNIHIPLGAGTAAGVPTFMPTLEGAALKEIPGYTALNDTFGGGGIKLRWLPINHVGCWLRLL
jgi:hypothetical protein